MSGFDKGFADDELPPAEKPESILGIIGWVVLIVVILGGAVYANYYANVQKVAVNEVARTSDHVDIKPQNADGVPTVPTDNATDTNPYTPSLTTVTPKVTPAP